MQAAEKLLKAFLVHHNRMPARTHDLIVLLPECVQTDQELRSLEDDCRRLTYYAVSVRYPSDLFEPGEDDGRPLVEAALRVREEVLRRLGTHAVLTQFLTQFLLYYPIHPADDATGNCGHGRGTPSRPLAANA